MYITINDIIGSKTIDLFYPIRSGMEIAVVSMLSDNVQCWLQGSIEVMLETGEKLVLNKVVYMGKELESLIGMKMKSRMDDHDDVLMTSMLDNGTKMTISLNELDNSDNLKDGLPSNALFTYYVTAPEYFTRFKPCTPQYKKLKNDTVTSLTLKIMDQAGNIVTKPGTTVVLHIK